MIHKSRPALLFCILAALFTGVIAPATAPLPAQAHEDEIAEARKAVHAQPGNAHAWNSLGQELMLACVEADDPRVALPLCKEATAATQKATELSPETPIYWVDLSEALQLEESYTRNREERIALVRREIGVHLEAAKHAPYNKDTWEFVPGALEHLFTFGKNSPEYFALGQKLLDRTQELTSASFTPPETTQKERATLWGAQGAIAGFLACNTPDVAKQQALFTLAQSSLATAMELNPKERMFWVDKGLFLGEQALKTPAAEEKKRLNAESDAAFTKAETIDPDSDAEEGESARVFIYEYWASKLVLQAMDQAKVPPLTEQEREVLLVQAEEKIKLMEELYSAANVHLYRMGIACAREDGKAFNTYLSAAIKESTADGSGYDLPVMLDNLKTDPLFATSQQKPWFQEGIAKLSAAMAKGGK